MAISSYGLSSYGLTPRCMALVPPYNTRVIAAQGSVINFTGSAIVNAANEGCISGGGVDGAVSDKGGDALHSARLALPIVRKPSVRCLTGDAKTTIGGELPCEWCIHAVGPNYNYVADDEGDLLLYMAYHASMREARKKACRTLAFSLLSAGIFRGQRALHTVIAIGVLAVHAALYEGLSDVFLVGFTNSDCETLTSVIDKLLMQPDAEDSRKQLLSQLSPRLQELHQRTLHGNLDTSPQIGDMSSTLAVDSVATSKSTAPASATPSAATSKGKAPASSTATFSMLGNSAPQTNVPVSSGGALGCSSARAALSTLPPASAAASKCTSPALATASAATSVTDTFHMHAEVEQHTFHMLGNTEPGKKALMLPAVQVGSLIDKYSQLDDDGDAAMSDEAEQVSSGGGLVGSSGDEHGGGQSVALGADSGKAAVVNGKHDVLPSECDVDEQLKVQGGMGDDGTRHTLHKCMPVEYLNAHVTISSSRVTQSGTIVHATHVYELAFRWEQTYFAFISDLLTAMQDSDSTSVKELASLPRDDFMTTLRWDACRPITRARSTLTMADALQPLDDNQLDMILEDR